MLCDYNKESDGYSSTRLRALEARKTRGWREYVKKGYKACRPRDCADERAKRVRTVGEAVMLFEGDNKFLKNEWFQGPFYSYDLNFKA